MRTKGRAEGPEAAQGGAAPVPPPDPKAPHTPATPGAPPAPDRALPPDIPTGDSATSAPGADDTARIRAAGTSAEAPTPTPASTPAPPLGTLPGPGRRRPARGARGRTSAAAGVLLAPFFVLFTAVTVVPIGYALWLSLFTEKQSGLGFGGARSVFSGLDNYTAALGDQAFREGFWVLAGYCVVYIPLMVGGALALALLLDSTLARARRFFQLALFLPHAVPGIIAALVWVYLYTPGLSPVVKAMNSGGIGFDFFSSGATLPSVVNIALWEWLGYNMVIFYAALQAIDRSVLEAATMDGAGEWRLAFGIKLPLIRASLTMVALFTVIGSLQLFTEPLILNQGGSSTVTSTWTPNMYAYTAAFSRGDYGLAAASAVLLALAAALLSFVVTRLTHRKGATA